MIFLAPFAFLAVCGVSILHLSWIAIAMALLDPAAMAFGDQRLTLMDRLLHTRIAVA